MGNTLKRIVVIGIVSTLFTGLSPGNDPAPEPYNKWCWKQCYCSGAAVQGQCTPAGVFCVANTCDSDISPFHGCLWKSRWTCVDSCDDFCWVGEQQYIATECGPECELLSYNQCACSCADLGANTVEGGVRRECR